MNTRESTSDRFDLEDISTIIRSGVNCLGAVQTAFAESAGDVKCFSEGLWYLWFKLLDDTATLTDIVNRTIADCSPEGSV